MCLLSSSPQMAYGMTSTSFSRMRCLPSPFQSLPKKSPRMYTFLNALLASPFLFNDACLASFLAEVGLNMFGFFPLFRSTAVALPR